MTGPEHYREAERLLDPHGPLYVVEPEGIPAIYAAAQVHATLALAAATALTDADPVAWAVATALMPPAGEIS